MKVDDEEVGAQFISRLANMPYFIGRIGSGIILFVLYLISAEWSYSFVIPPSTSAVFWLPSGLTAAVFIRARWEPKIWPFWIVAFAMAELMIVSIHGVPLSTALIWASANAVLPLWTILLSKLFIQSPFDFRKIRDVLTFVMIVFLAVLPGSIIGAIGSLVGFPGVKFFSAALNWGMSDALGILLGAPLILIWTARSSKTIGNLRELFILFLALTVVILLIIFSPNHILDRSFFSFSIFFVGWTAIRFGPKGTSLALLAFDLILVWATVNGFGTFANLDIDAGNRIFSLQIVVANIGFLMLLLAAAIEEQRAARISAEAALKMRDDFLAVAAHELKTPLTSLMMQVQFINRLIKQGKLIDMPQERLDKLASISDRDMHRFSNLINDLLDVTRISSGKILLNPETVDLVEIIKETISRFSLELERDNCIVELLGDPHVIGDWDRSRIDQIITNLLSNSIKYGEGKPIEIFVKQDGLFAIFTIRDHGIGISKEDQARIFDRFERAVSVNRYGGLGLGLFISSQIAAIHNGSIKVESEIGEGSLFTVKLPIRFQHASL